MSPTLRRSGLVLLWLALGLAARAQTVINVDASLDRKPIDPRVYGLAYADTATLTDLNVTLNRRGGNNTSRYNWQENADNRGADWYFQSVPLGDATPAGDADAFVQSTRNAYAEPMMTIPMIGWLGKLAPNRDKQASFLSTTYGAQTDCDWTWFPTACNGILTNGQNVTGNNPNDASVLKDATYQREFVQHEVTKWGASIRGGMRYYILDNESAIWYGTHRDVHPVGPNMEEIRDKMIDYAARIREGDATAVIAGPEEWGWTNYLYSGYDGWYAGQHGWGFLPDRAAHGNMDYMPWLLQQLQQADATSGRRTIDVFTLHYYPQGGEFGDNVSLAMQQRRNRSTRSLWDPNYVDETWINDKVKLIPRMKAWVSSYYPGLETGITEYNWGAEGHMNGATTQADVLGIFGREGLDLAARWTTPGNTTPTYKAIKLFRNYDGQKRGFGDIGVRATTPNPDTVSAFGAVRTTDGALTVMVISKADTGSANVTVNLAGFTPAGTVDVWRLAGNAITHPAGLTLSGSSFSATVPSPSVTLFVVPSANPARPRGDFNLDGQADLLWRNTANGQLKIDYMTGARRSGSATVNVAEPDPNWQLVGTHDFSLDGKTDMLWRHAVSGALRIWAMDGPTRLATTELVPAAVPDLGWKVVATGDFNSDGKPDIVWRHVSSGRNVVWTMNGTTRIAGVFTSPDAVTDLNWGIAGSADMNSDGQNDLLWRHALSGNLVVWLMNGTVRTSGTFLNPSSLGDTNWRMAAIGDFSRDGRPDVVWRHGSSARTVLWEQKGLNRSYGLYTTPDVIEDLNWSLVGPR